jgi:hypothetical protein
MAKLKKKTRGGKRPLSGRKKAPYETKTIAFRVRVEWVEVIKLTVKSKVAELVQLVEDSKNKNVNLKK